MKILGITGGVGAGKSTVLEYLASGYGALIISCDEVGRALQQPGGSCFDGMVSLFGTEVLKEDRSLDREKISRKVFEDKELLERLNGLIHPAVRQEVERLTMEASKEGRPLAVVESAILLECGYDRICDEIWYIHTDIEKRIRRLAISRGYTREKTLRVAGAQKSEEYFREHCSLVIDNSSDDPEDTYRQIDEGLRTHGLL